MLRSWNAAGVKTEFQIKLRTESREKERERERAKSRHYLSVGECAFSLFDNYLKVLDAPQ